MLIRRLLLFLSLTSSTLCGFAQIAEMGEIDLRNYEFESSIPLDGEWQFVWNEFLETEEMNAILRKDYFHVPQVWNDEVTQLGVPLDSKGFATYKLRMLLPQGMQPMLYIKHFYSSYRLTINGKLAAFNGMVGHDSESYKPAWVPQTVDLTTFSDTLNLVFHVANFDHRLGGIRESIFIGKKAEIFGEYNLVFGSDLLLAGCLIMCGLFFLGLYFLASQKNYVLYYSIFCLAFSYRILAADDYALNILYPNFNWFVAVRLEYLSLYLPVIFFSLYTDSLFAKDSKFKILRINAIIASLGASITLIASEAVYMSLLPYFLPFVIFSILCCTAVYFIAWMKKRDGAAFAVLSSFVMFIVVLYKTLDYVEILREHEMVSFLGYLLFFFFQSWILFFLFTSSLKKARDQAEQASKSKSDFLSMMSHEIRTPMNAVIGLTNYLLQEEPKQDQIETLNTLKFSAKNLLVIINDILDFSKIEAQKMEFESQSTNLKELLVSMERVFMPAFLDKNLDFEFEIDPRVPDRVFCDSTRTTQILTNLINNAVKFTEKGGVMVKLEFVRELGDEVDIKFSVRDTGIGIAKDKIGEIFQSFTQASTSTTRLYGGTGLGLSITKELLRLQNSELNVGSILGEGSVFYFTIKFPIDRSIFVEESHYDMETPMIPAECRILVVEDNVINTIVVKKFLHKWGFTVVDACNGREAVDIFEQDKDLDLILMDIQMPVMDGYEAARTIRKMGGTLPILALTASALIEDQNSILKAGMEDFVIKPFDPDNLLQKISQYCQKSSD